MPSKFSAKKYQRKIKDYYHFHYSQYLVQIITIICNIISLLNLHKLQQSCTRMLVCHSLIKLASTHVKGWVSRDEWLKAELEFRLCQKGRSQTTELGCGCTFWMRSCARRWSLACAERWIQTWIFLHWSWIWFYNRCL